MHVPGLRLHIHYLRSLSCSRLLKKAVSKAAASEDPKAYPWGTLRV